MSVAKVFRVHLPLAGTLARNSAKSERDPDRAEQAAELDLARAVLAWRQHDCTAFVAFARGVIVHQLQGEPRRRHSAATPDGCSERTAPMTARPRSAN